MTSLYLCPLFDCPSSLFKLAQSSGNVQVLSDKYSCGLEEKSTITQVRVQGGEHIHFICPYFKKETSRWKVRYIFILTTLMRVTFFFMSETMQIIYSKRNVKSPPPLLRNTFVYFHNQVYGACSVWWGHVKFYLYKGEQTCHHGFSTDGFAFGWRGELCMLEMMMLSEPAMHHGTGLVASQNHSALGFVFLFHLLGWNRLSLLTGKWKGKSVLWVTSKEKYKSKIQLLCYCGACTFLDSSWSSLIRSLIICVDMLGHSCSRSKRLAWRLHAGWPSTFWSLILEVRN